MPPGNPAAAGWVPFNPNWRLEANWRINCSATSFTGTRFCGAVVFCGMSHEWHPTLGMGQIMLILGAKTPSGTTPMLGSP